MSDSNNIPSWEKASQTGDSINSYSSICSDTETNSTNQSKKRCHEGPGGFNKKSFIWKYFVEKNNPSGPDTITACTLNLSSDQSCSTSYAAFGNTSNAITHLANVYGIVEQEKFYIKVRWQNVLLFLLSLL